MKQKDVLTEKSLREARSDLERVKAEEYSVIQEMKSLRVKVEESRSSFQASRSRGRVLDSLMQQKREGALPGLYGRLVSILYKFYIIVYRVDFSFNKYKVFLTMFRALMVNYSSKKVFSYYV